MVAYPEIQENVKSRYCKHQGGQVKLFPVGFDVKQAEAFTTLFLDQQHTSFCSEMTPQALPVFCYMPPEKQRFNLEELYLHFSPKVSIIFDLHDAGHDSLALSEIIWRHVVNHNLQLIYLKLQMANPLYYQAANPFPSQVHILSCPLLLGGSRFHITWQDDFEGQNLFRNIFNDNENPDYKYDWSWVGANTGARGHVLDQLKVYNQRPCYLKVAEGGHSDANVATTPYDEYIRIARASRINISLNGVGPFCLKDGELFCHHCFVLREFHPAIAINPLGPRNDKEWAVFQPQHVGELCELMLSKPEKREEIRHAGHAYFRRVLFEHYYAKTYGQALVQYLKYAAKQAWGQLAVS